MTHGNPLAYAFVNAFAAEFVDYLSFDESGVDSVNPNAIGRRFLRCAFGHAEYRQLAGNVGKGAGFRGFLSQPSITQPADLICSSCHLNSLRKIGPYKAQSQNSAIKRPSITSLPSPRRHSSHHQAGGLSCNRTAPCRSRISDRVD